MFKVFKKQNRAQEQKEASKKFDLNIEKILEDWEVYHAVREIIANAIDEQILTETRLIEIWKDEEGRWHIRDFGRGLRYEHLTQKENDEKLKNPHVIGKFGIGLKDALAMFDRHNIKVFIRSKHGDITIGKSQKHGFENIVTLHAYINPPSDPNFVGTEFILEGVTDEDIRKAKDLFLMFSGERLIERTKFGEVLEKKGDVAKIYINGVKVAEEENFLFSYNITSLTKKIKKALNRERTNVGRGAYSERVKSILLSCKSKEVAELLINDLKNYFSGEIHDELKWIDVQEHAVKILNATERVVFLTPEELMTAADIVDEAKSAGYRIVTIPENLKKRVRGSKDISDNPIRDLVEFYREYRESFEYKFVDVDQLTEEEKRVFALTDKIFDLIGGRPEVIKQVRISETIRKDLESPRETVGVWEPKTGSIIIKRTQLRSVEDYAGTLLHEVAHAISGTSDVTREFELVLTELLGKVAKQALKGDLA
ncbi:MAG: ATP-binding protein [Epsilonproteobacteria bacterium]|nr:ATP-binding protein [Campylobacterota bacterium]